MAIANSVSPRAAAVRHAQRAAGQLSAIASMVATRRSFPDVAQQLLAARGSLDSLLLRIVELELEGYIAASDERVEIERVLQVALGHTRQRHRGGPSLRQTAGSRPAGKPLMRTRLSMEK